MKDSNSTNKVTANRVISGIGYTILGVLIAVGPQTIFPVCEAMGDGFMKCHWTAQAEIGCGAVIAVLGIFLLFLSSESVRAGIQGAILVQFLPVLLIPNVLIGVCGGNHMICHSLTRPVLNVLAVAGILAGVVNLLYLWRKRGRSEHIDAS